MEKKLIAIEKIFDIKLNNLNKFESKITKKIKKALQKSFIIKENLKEIPSYNIQLQDVTLMQEFLIEQFSSFKQYIVKEFLLKYDGNIETVNGFLYYFAWLIYIFCNLFFIYWIFSWAITNGTSVFKNWAINVSINFVYQILLLECFYVYIVYFQIIQPNKKEVHSL
jgi:hypothetical protein